MNAVIFEYTVWTNITDPSYLHNVLEDTLNRAKFSIIGFIDHNFDPFGYTAIWLIQESHLAVHTFPEADKTYVQLSSCNEQKHNAFIQLLNEVLSKSEYSN